MKYRGARIQVLDLPGIIEGAADGRGRGRQVISTARTCNLILIVLDASKPVTHKKIIEQELFSFGIRINQQVRCCWVIAGVLHTRLETSVVSFAGFFLTCFSQPPDVRFVKKESGGIGYQEMAKQTKGMNAEVARLVCKEYKISCAEIILREDITVDQLIDVIEGDRAYIPGMYCTKILSFRRRPFKLTPSLCTDATPILNNKVLYVFNKIDSLFIEELDILDQLHNVVPISSQHEWNLEELMDEIWERCNMLRVYTKPKGQIPDYDEPVILHAANPTIEEFCNRLHRTLINDFAFAWVWGRSAKHQPQRCGKDHVLCDEDIVQIVKKV